MAAALQPAETVRSATSSARPSAVDLLPTAAPGTPVPELILQAQNRPGFADRLGAIMERARSLDAAEEEESRGVKRAAEEELDKPAASSGAEVAPVAHEEQLPVFGALIMNSEQLKELADARNGLHPLLRAQAGADLDRRDPEASAEVDHGTWDGRWAFMCEAD